MQPERLNDSSRGQVRLWWTPPTVIAVPDPIDPEKVALAPRCKRPKECTTLSGSRVLMVQSSGGGGSLATGYFLAGIQPASTATASVTHP
jgi:hypothetical protein